MLGELSRHRAELNGVAGRRGLAESSRAVEQSEQPSLTACCSGERARAGAAINLGHYLCSQLVSSFQLVPQCWGWEAAAQPRAASGPMSFPFLSPWCPRSHAVLEEHGIWLQLQDFGFIFLGKSAGRFSQLVLRMEAAWLQRSGVVGRCLCSVPSCPLLTPLRKASAT